MRRPALLFNIASYSRLLLEEFHSAGGRIETLTLDDRSDFVAIDERTIVNCTGYGDRRVSVYPRRDGLLVQAQAEGDFNNDKENIDPQESITAVERLAQIVRETKLKG